MAPSSNKPQGKKNPRDAPKLNKSSKKPFKPNKGQNNAARSEAMAVQLEDDVPDFPRGSYSLPSIVIVSLQSFAAIQIFSVYLVDYTGNQRESDLFIFFNCRWREFFESKRT